MYLDRERRTATAGTCCTRVLDDELSAFQSFCVVDLCTYEVLIAHGINEKLHAVLFHDSVIFVADLIEGETILQAGATATRHENTKLEVGIAFFLNQRLDLVGCTIGKK